MHLKIFFFSFLLSLFTISSIYGRDSTLTTNSGRKAKFTGLFWQRGRVLQSNDFVRGLNSLHDPIDDFQAFSLRFGWNTTGKKIWQQLYHNPVYGIRHIGYQVSEQSGTWKTHCPVWIFLLLRFSYINKLALLFDAGFGITLNWESFEVTDNTYNIAIGAEQSVYIDLGLKMEYRLTNHWKLSAGASFTHFSNGALKKPNMGINTFAPKLSLAYYFQPSPEYTKKYKIPDHKPENSVSASLYAGWKNVLYTGSDADSITAFKGVYYNVYGLSTVFNRQISHKSKIGIGTTIGYLGAANSSITLENGKLDDNDASLREGIELSIYPSYELMINKLSLLIQPGFYLYRYSYDKQTPIMYQRIGLKYQIFKNMFAGLNLHAYKFYISDYIEWNIGYTFK